jgi:hypothetical protein
VPDDQMPDFLHQMTFTVMTHSGKEMTVAATDVNGHMMVMIPADQATDYLHQMISRVQ